MKRAVVKNFAIFTGKHLCWSLFLMKLQAWRPAILLKRDPTQVFYYEYLEIFKNTFSEKHMQTAAFAYVIFYAKFQIFLHFPNALYSSFLVDRLLLNSLSLREKCPDTKFFLVRIFLYSGQIHGNTDQKKLRIWTLFTHSYVFFYLGDKLKPDEKREMESEF